ncbi:hypothetical protein MMC11_004173 [Xylographa trunciseda]|nr:hypothetical protein [Xylographa trunciseda]
MSEPSTIPVAPPPWTLKATVYMFAFHVPSKQPLPSFAYSPLESQSAFASSSKFCGGLGSVQVIRYTESPVGPYDEMLLVPGNFEYESKEGGKVTTKRNLQVSRIYVSQKLTCYNGRINFNLVQPPLPEGQAKGGELAGTNDWCKILPLEYSSKTSMTWVDLQQVAKTVGGDSGKPQKGDTPSTTGGSESAAPGKAPDGVYSDFENWWPGLGRWQIGLKMEDATIEFGEGKHWD